MLVVFFPIFEADTKIIFSYNFRAPKRKIMCRKKLYLKLGD